MSEYDESLWGQFCERFDSAVSKCAEDGTKSRLTLGIGERTVMVDIYEQGSTMKKFDEIILSTVKKETRIDLVEP